MLAVGRAGRRPVAPDAGVAHGQGSVGHAPGCVAHCLGIYVAAVGVQQLLVAVAVSAAGKPLQPGVGAQTIQAQQQPAPHLVAVGRLAGGRGGEGVGEANSEVRLLEHVQQARSRPAPAKLSLDSAQA